MIFNKACVSEIKKFLLNNSLNHMILKSFPFPKTQFYFIISGVSGLKCGCEEYLSLLIIFGC